MEVIKRDGQEVTFDEMKIYTAIMKAMKYGSGIVDEHIARKIANEIKAHGGNGILDLKIEYGLIGLGGDSFQITAMGMGVKFKD